MMRILFAIPHYYTAEGGGRHGSEGGDAERRARATRLCLAALQQTFSESRGLSDGRGGVSLHAANPNLRATITIALCTTGDKLGPLPDETPIELGDLSAEELARLTVDVLWPPTQEECVARARELMARAYEEVVGQKQNPEGA